MERCSYLDVEVYGDNTGDAIHAEIGKGKSFDRMHLHQLQINERWRESDRSY
jgi:hypothetical protein